MQCASGLSFLFCATIVVMRTGADEGVMFGPTAQGLRGDGVNTSLQDDAMGYIRALPNYMFCNPSCAMVGATSQQFRFSGGQFHAYDLSGKDLSACLNAGGNGNAVTLGACDVPSSQNWAVSGGFITQFAYGAWWGMQFSNYPQTWLRIAFCTTFPSVNSCLAVLFPVEVPCALKSQTVTNLKCKNQLTQGTCSAGFQPGTTQGAHSEQTCNACDAPSGSSTKCDFKMSLQTSNSISSTMTSSTTSTNGLKIQVGLDFIVDDKETYEYSISRELTIGQTTTETKTYSIEQGCSTTITNGTAANAIANVLTGTLIGDYTATQTSIYECKTVAETVSGTITITNVPTLAIEGSCTIKKVACNSSSIYGIVV